MNLLQVQYSLFNPASTTYVKHFIANTNNYDTDAESWVINASLYGRLWQHNKCYNAVQFQMSSGNFDGIITITEKIIWSYTKEIHKGDCSWEQ
jgi:hypothetical protein